MIDSLMPTIARWARRPRRRVVSLDAGTQTRTIEEVIAARAEKAGTTIDLVRMDDDGGPQAVPTKLPTR